jgi:hypothetical protein
MRSPDDDPLPPVTLPYVAQLSVWLRASRPSVSCSVQTGPCASDTASRVDEFNRRARNCFNFRAPTPSRSAPGKHPYKILLRRMFFFRNWKRTQYTGNGSPTSNRHSALSPAGSVASLSRCRRLVRSTPNEPTSSPLTSEKRRKITASERRLSTCS